MARVVTAIIIRAPRQRVFDYITTPSNWPGWHPSSLAVFGATNHSLEVGEQVTEDFLIAGRRVRVVWTVHERQEGASWVIEGQVASSGSGTIRYTLAEVPEGTHFTRNFVYTMTNPVMALLDLLYVCRRITRDSAIALANVARILERQATPAPRTERTGVQ
jgi:hypothetical protein